MQYADEVLNVTDRESFETARQLSRIEGIFCGGSTGTTRAAARAWREADENAVIGFIVQTRASTTFSKFHSMNG
jgi:cysteine synthase